MKTLFRVKEGTWKYIYACDVLCVLAANVAIFINLYYSPSLANDCVATILTGLGGTLNVAFVRKARLTLFHFESCLCIFGAGVTTASSIVEYWKKGKYIDEAGRRNLTGEKRYCEIPKVPFARKRMQCSVSSRQVRRDTAVPSKTQNSQMYNLILINAPFTREI